MHSARYIKIEPWGSMGGSMEIDDDDIKKDKQEPQQQKNKRKPTQWQGVYSRTGARTRRKDGTPIVDTCFDITYKLHGRKVWEKVGWQGLGFSAKLASLLRAERLRELAITGVLPEKEGKPAPLFDDIAQKYLDWAKGNKAREGYDDANRYNNHLKDSIGNKRLDALTPILLEKLKNDLYKKDLADATVKHIMVLIRMIWNKAMAWNLWDGENPIKRVKLPTLQNRRERYLSPEEAALLLAKLKERSLTTHDIALLSLRCGLRFGEIASLRRMDIDLENGVINVADPKNKSSRKTFMTPAVREILQARLPANPEEYIFADEYGVKVRISKTFERVIDDLGWNAGITDRRQKVTFHTLRHTHASLLAIQGESLIVIAEALGHKSLQMVKRYAHLSDTTRRQAAEKLERTMDEATLPKPETFEERRPGENSKDSEMKAATSKKAVKKSTKKSTTGK